MTKIYVIEETYEKNASDGISYYTDRNELAEAVYEAEQRGAHVQVYKCVPIEHNAYFSTVTIDLWENTNES
jgi:hypothetical protein